MATPESLNPTFSHPGIGLGCMNLCHGYGEPLEDKDAIRLLRTAFDMGYRHFDTATLYGATRNESQVGEALSERRSEFFLASKCGLEIDREQGCKVINGRPETLRRQCEASLSRLKTDHIDLYYLHRLDPDVPVEESVGALADLVARGHIGAIGLSEISATTLQRAQREAPIAAVQNEYSLWTRNPEIALLEACKSNGTAMVAFSPLGRGFLAGTINADTTFSENDMRASMPRFQDDNRSHNLKWIPRFCEIARELSLTPAQLALAWIKTQDEDIVPIPGTQSIAHMEENLAAAEVRLDAGVCAELNTLINHQTVAGNRYGPAAQRDTDTEVFSA